MIMNYSFFLLRRKVIIWVRKTISGLMSDLSSFIKKDMVTVRSVIGELEEKIVMVD